MKLYSVEKCGCSIENGIVGISSYPYPAEGEAQQSTMLSSLLYVYKIEKDERKESEWKNWVR